MFEGMLKIKPAMTIGDLRLQLEYLPDNGIIHLWNSIDDPYRQKTPNLVFSCPVMKGTADAV
jgi:hypothetical protein